MNIKDATILLSMQIPVQEKDIVTSEYCEALKTLLKSTEYRIGKVPIIQVGSDCDLYGCPTCGAGINEYFQHFCSKCGQRLEW